MRNKDLEKDDILLSLVERLKSSEARFSAQAETQEAEMLELKKKVAEATENFDIEVVKHEICEIEISRAQKMSMSFVPPKKNVVKYPWNALRT